MLPGARRHRRILDAPDLFIKTQRQAQEKPPDGTGAELLRDLEMIACIVSRAQRRLTGAAATELDAQQGKAARYQIERIEKQLQATARVWFAYSGLDPQNNDKPMAVPP